MNIIQDIYINSAQPSERSLRNDKKYSRAKNKIKQYYGILSERLSKDDMSVIDKLMSCYDKQTNIKSMYCFESGFKAGLATAVESLNDKE